MVATGGLLLVQGGHLVDAAEVYICRGPVMEEVHRESLGTRWCFRCRGRTEFDYVVTAPKVPSYYGPTPSVQCASGHHDGDIGFGGSREWDGW